MRLLHLLVIGVLVFAAAYVYQIKIESTVAHRARAAAACRNSRAARRHRGAARRMGQARMRRRGCRAWPSGICTLKPVDATQYDQLDEPAGAAAELVKPGDPDPIGAMIETIDAAVMPTVTGSVPAPEDAR